MNRDGLHFLKHGPFAQSMERAHEFGSNLLVLGMVSDAIIKMNQASAELDDAIKDGDTMVIEQKKLEVEAWKSSLKLTCFLLETEELEALIT